MMVFKMFHPSQLSLLFNRLVSRSVFPYTESIVSPYVFYWQSHQTGQPDCRFHVIRKYEECSACRYYTAMEGHSIHHGCHCKFRNSCLKKSSCEIALYEGMSVFQEAICFIGI